MSVRSRTKVISKEARTLKSLRERAGLSMRNAAEKSMVSFSTINHLENGRHRILEHHLESLLPVYGLTRSEFSAAAADQSLLTFTHDECIRLIRELSDEDVVALLHFLKRMRLK